MSSSSLTHMPHVHVICMKGLELMILEYMKAQYSLRLLFACMRLRSSGLLSSGGERVSRELQYMFWAHAYSS